MNKLTVKQLNDLREAAKEHGQDWVDLCDMALQVGDFEILKAENLRLLGELAELKAKFRVNPEGDREIDELKTTVRLDKEGDRLVDEAPIRKPYVK